MNLKKVIANRDPNSVAMIEDFLEHLVLEKLETLDSVILNEVLQGQPPNSVTMVEDDPSPLVELPDELKENVVNNLTLTDCWHLRETNTAFKKACSKKIDAFKKFNKDIKGFSKEFQKILIQLYKNDPTLTKLDLVGDNIGDSGAQALAEALKVNQSITSLALENNNIGDSGAQALAEALKDNQAITWLSLWDNNISSEELNNQIEAKIKQNKDSEQP